jgi:hypothetical protein
MPGPTPVPEDQVMRIQSESIPSTSKPATAAPSPLARDFLCFHIKIFPDLLDSQLEADQLGTPTRRKRKRLPTVWSCNAGPTSPTWTTSRKWKSKSSKLQMRSRKLQSPNLQEGNHRNRKWDVQTAAFPSSLENHHCHFHPETRKGSEVLAKSSSH